MDVAVDVRMAVDELVAQSVGHVRIVERAGLFAQLGVEHDVEQQVAQLLLDALHIVIEQRVGQLVGLLDRVAA